MHRLIVATLALSTFALSGCSLGRALRVASSLTAHELCSQTFVAGQPPDAVFREYVQPMVGVPGVKQALRFQVDTERRQVTASVAGAFAARASYAEGRGCTVVHGARAPAPIALEPDAEPGAPLPEGLAAAPPQLGAAIERAFAEPPDGPRLARKAIVIVHEGQVIAERYAAGYGPGTPLQSWSMAKSVTNALVAILVRQGRLEVGEPAPVARWRLPGDPHAGVTVDQLLRQTSGQPFGQTNSGFDPSTRMQFLEPDTAGFSAAAPFDGAPGERWAYTDGNYAILSGLVRDAVGGTPEAVARFARAELFAPLGMRSAMLEFDEAGNPMGATWVFATARDWARFGMLYLDDGVAAGRRILPEGWVAYSAAPTPQAELGYGAGFWTNAGPSAGATRRRGWGMPPDSFFGLGNSGQVVLVIPSRRLVVVSLGFALDPTNRAPMQGVARLAVETIALLDGRP